MSLANWDYQLRDGRLARKRERLTFEIPTVEECEPEMHLWDEHDDMREERRTDCVLGIWTCADCRGNQVDAACMSHLELQAIGE